jgi:hypothetical protein
MPIIYKKDILSHEIQISREHISRNQHAKVNDLTNITLPPK